MENTKYTEKLAKTILIAAAILLICTICWYFKSVIIYILASVVVSLLARPIMGWLGKISIKGHMMPAWIKAIISLLIIMSVLILVITMIIPVMSSIIKGISLESIESAARHISVPLANLNEFLRTTFPKLGSDYRVEIALLQELQNLTDLSAFSTVIGSAASLVSSIGIALFSIVFISFFFIKEENTFSNIVSALVPDKHEENTSKAISDIGHLLSRYFGGVVIEVLGVGFLNFLGLMFIAQIGFGPAIGIAFLTGILNIIPYVGPLIGGVLGTTLGLIIKYSSAIPIGLDVSFLWFTIILIAIFSFTQLVDNFLYQPLIYSTSIKAKPLEIFIVLLIAGNIAGPAGMIIAIPCYTAIRVIAFRFFGNIKAIKRLIPSESQISEK